MDHLSETKKLYTLVEACKALSISMPTAKRWIYGRKLLAHRVGGRWMVPEEEIRKFFTYKVSREPAMLYANADLSDEEAGDIADVLSAALRQVGAPVRTDGIKKIVVGTIPPDPVFWRFLKRVLSAGSNSPESSL